MKRHLNRLACPLLAIVLLAACFHIPAFAGNAALLPDGVYKPSLFTFSGGTGKTVISCESVTVEEGRATARIVFSSPYYAYVKRDGVQFDGEHTDSTSIFEIPVTLNADNTIAAMTTRMSTDHEITYVLSIYMGDVDEPEEAVQEAPYKPASKMPPETGDLVFESILPLDYAQGFTITCYQGGYQLVDVQAGSRYLIVPEGMPVPGSLGGDVVILKQPFERIYLAATSAMALFDALDALPFIRFSGTAASGWYIENASAAMARGEMLFAGKYSAPDYELLLAEGCDLAIESTMIFHSPKTLEMLARQGIPVFIDRSSYEPHPLGRTEWIKLYGALLGRQAEAETAFTMQAQTIEQLAGYPNMGKTVAFFSMRTDGKIAVRNVTDYVPRMIEIAGGRYVFDSIRGAADHGSSVSMTFEEFYAAALDADYLIYNATIGTPLKDLAGLLHKSELFADFRAVREGNVWCTDKYLYQATDIVGEMIMDIYRMLRGEQDGMTFIYKLE